MPALAAARSLEPALVGPPSPAAEQAGNLGPLPLAGDLPRRRGDHLAHRRPVPLEDEVERRLLQRLPQRPQPFGQQVLVRPWERAAGDELVLAGERLEQRYGLADAG